jgi:hypothetical protein
MVEHKLSSFQLTKLSRHSHKRFHRGYETKNAFKGQGKWAINRGEKAEAITNYFEKQRMSGTVCSDPNY